LKCQKKKEILSKKQKILISSWAFSKKWQKKVATEFQVTKYMVEQARKLKKEKGILAIPDAKKGNTLQKHS